MTLLKQLVASPTVHNNLLKGEMLDTLEALEMRRQSDATPVPPPIVLQEYVLVCSWLLGAENPICVTMYAVCGFRDDERPPDAAVELAAQRDDHRMLNKSEFEQDIATFNIVAQGVMSWLAVFHSSVY